MSFIEGEDVIAVLDDDGKRVSTWFLSNLRHELDRTPESEHEGVFKRFLDGIGEAGARSRTYSDVRPHLRVLLKDQSYPSYINLVNRVEMPGEEGSPVISRSLAADVIACCIEETASSLNFITERDVKEWGVTAEQALDDAFANIRALTIEFHEVNGARFVLAQDSFIAARLLCEEQIRALPLQGMPVAVVPDRDTLFVVGSEDAEGLSKLAGLVRRQLTEASRHVSPRPLMLTSQGWGEFVPPEPSRMAFANIARQYDSASWNEYKRFLERDLEQRGEDIFVATLNVYEINDTGEVFTCITWSRDVDSIFPEADRVCFFDSIDETIRVAAWVDVFRVMGAEMVRMEGLPPRYRVREFPTPEQLLSMGAKLV